MGLHSAVWSHSLCSELCHARRKWQVRYFRQTVRKAPSFTNWNLSPCRFKPFWKPGRDVCVIVGPASFATQHTLSPDKHPKDWQENFCSLCTVGKRCICCTWTRYNQDWWDRKAWRRRLSYFQASKAGRRLEERKGCCHQVQANQWSPRPDRVSN